MLKICFAFNPIAYGCPRLRYNMRGVHMLLENSVCILFISSEWIGIFLTKFGNSDPSYNRSILKLLYLKFEASVHEQIDVIH